MKLTVNGPKKIHEIYERMFKIKDCERRELTIVRMKTETMKYFGDIPRMMDSDVVVLLSRCVIPGTIAYFEHGDYIYPYEIVKADRDIFVIALHRRQLLRIFIPRDEIIKNVCMMCLNNDVTRLQYHVKTHGAADHSSDNTCARKNGVIVHHVNVDDYNQLLSTMRDIKRDDDIVYNDFRFDIEFNDCCDHFGIAVYCKKIQT